MVVRDRPTDRPTDRPAGRAQRHRPLFDVGRPPPPRVLAGEGLEASQRLVATVHCRGGQQSALLLQSPAGQDRFEHRRLGVQQGRAVDEHQTRRAGHLTRSSHQHSASQPGPMLGATSLHPMQPRGWMPLRHNEYRAIGGPLRPQRPEPGPIGCSILHPVE